MTYFESFIQSFIIRYPGNNSESHQKQIGQRSIGRPKKGLNLFISFNSNQSNQPDLGKVDYSGLNYKDGMAICGIYGVVETLPLITGIDFVGVVDASRHGKDPKLRSLFHIQISIDIPKWMRMFSQKFSQQTKGTEEQPGGLSSLNGWGSK